MIARPRGGRSLLATTTAVVCLAAGCTGSPSGPSAAGPTTGTGLGAGAQATAAATASVPPATPWESELANLAPDGSRSAASALRLFAMAFGPLPGVDRAADPGPIPSGSLAVRAVRAHWIDLTADQRAAITAALAAPAGALRGEVTASGVSAADRGSGSLEASLSILRLPVEASAAEQLLAAFEAVTLQMRQTIGARLGGDNAGAIDLILAPANDAAGDFAYADPQFANGRYASCPVTIFPKTATAEPIVITNTMAHEIFHCFEAAGVDSQAAWNQSHDWWVEGGSEWVGDTIGGNDAHSVAYWYRWLTAPRNLLFARTYDGEGFFAHLDESGVSPWTAFPKLFAAPDDPARFTAALGDAADRFLDGWASSLVREPARGPAWDATGPGITGDQASPEPIAVGDAEAEVAVSPYSAAVFSVQTASDIVQVAVLGNARISDGESDVTSVVSAAFCTRDGGCPDTCPDGSPLPESIPVLHSPFLLALSGGAAGTQGTLLGTSIDSFCQEPSADRKAVQVKDIEVIGGHPITFVNMVSCDGPWGHWSGVFYGIQDYSRPIEAYLGGAGPGDASVTVTPGTAQLPDGVLQVSGDVEVSVQGGGTTLVLSGVTNVVFQGPNGPLKPDRNKFSVAYRIDPADPGRCP